MRILVPHNDVANGYMPSLVEAYRKAHCEVVVGRANFYLSNYRPDMLHIHWPEQLYDEDCVPFRTPDDVIMQRVRFYKDNGAKIVATAHNLLPHGDEVREKTQGVYASVFGAADVIVHHGRASIELVKEKYPETVQKTHIVCPHGHYAIHYRALSKGEARGHLKLPQHGFIILSFGNIKPYKGFRLLRQVFRKWKHNGKLLLVAGSYQCGRNLFARLRRRGMEFLGRYIGNECFHFRRIRTEDIGYYFAAADVVLASHMDGLTSGILPMAATYSRPVVYPNIGNFQEQMEGWIGESYECGDVGSALVALDTLAARLKAGADFDNSRWLANNSWETHVKRILSAVSEVNRCPETGVD